MLYAEFPALCEAVYVSLVVENPLTGTKCIVDVKVDTGSPYTILPKEVMDNIGLTPFTTETLETVSGELFETAICMGRLHLDDSGDYVDLPIHVANEALSMPLLDFTAAGGKALALGCTPSFRKCFCRDCNQLYNVRRLTPAHDASCVCVIAWNFGIIAYIIKRRLAIAGNKRRLDDPPHVMRG